MEHDIDISVAHSARVHDYWLGGTDNIEPGRLARGRPAVQPFGYVGRGGA